MKRFASALIHGVLAILVLFTCSGCSVFLTHAVESYVDRAPRDPDTGILTGMEPYEMGPADGNRAVLLVHGYVGCPNNFGALPDLLAARGWRVEAMLVPGHGTTPFELEETTVAAMRDAVAARMQALEAHYDTVVLVGHSMGATLAVLALEDASPDALVLASPFFALTYRWFYVLPPGLIVDIAAEPLRWAYRAPERRPVRDRSARTKALAYEWFPTRPAPALLDAARSAGDADRLGGITIPTLVLQGRHDTITSPWAAKRAYGELGAENKRFVWLKRTDHVTFWDYDREQAIEEVVTFLAPLEHE